MLIGPVQFSPSVRNKNPVLHRRLGYVFVGATLVAAVTGATSMANVSELGRIALFMSRIMGPLTVIYLAISVNAARNKDFQKHRRYMLRSAVIGYVKFSICRSNTGMMNCARLLGLNTILQILCPFVLSTYRKQYDCRFRYPWVRNPPESICLLLFCNRVGTLNWWHLREKEDDQNYNIGEIHVQLEVIVDKVYGTCLPTITMQFPTFLDH